jgi:hypothetical protein
MAKLSAVKLKLDSKGAKTAVEVTYTITFSKKEVDEKVVFKETCRLIGDDTDVGDPASAGADDVLGFLTPMFNKRTASGTAVDRHLKKSLRTAQLDEDRGNVPNPDEIRALVTLIPVKADAAKPVARQSAMVKRKIG